MNSRPQGQEKPRPAVITDSKVVSKPGATLEVRVIEISGKARQAISEGLKHGKAAAYVKTSN